jgi:hypothetical protein
MWSSRYTMAMKQRNRSSTNKRRVSSLIKFKGGETTFSSPLYAQ